MEQCSLVELSYLQCAMLIQYDIQVCIQTTHFNVFHLGCERLALCAHSFIHLSLISPSIDHWSNGIFM